MKMKCKRFYYRNTDVEQETNKALEFCNQIGIDSVISIQEIQEHTTYQRYDIIRSDPGHITIWYKE